MIRLSLFPKEIFSHRALYFTFKKEGQIPGYYDTSCVIVSDAPNISLTVLSNPAKRQEYDKKGILYVQDQNVVDYLNRHKGLILTCNGLGIRYSVW